MYSDICCQCHWHWRGDNWTLWQSVGGCMHVMSCRWWTAWIYSSISTVPTSTWRFPYTHTHCTSVGYLCTVVRYSTVSMYACLQCSAYLPTLNILLWCCLLHNFGLSVKRIYLLPMHAQHTVSKNIWCRRHLCHACNFNICMTVQHMCTMCYVVI